MSRFERYEGRRIGSAGVTASDNGDVLTLRCKGPCGPGAEKWSNVERVWRLLRGIRSHFVINRGTRRISFESQGRNTESIAWSDVEDLEVILRSGLPVRGAEASFRLKLRGAGHWLICEGPEPDVVAVRALLIAAMRLDPRIERHLGETASPLGRSDEILQRGWREPPPGGYQREWRRLRRLRWGYGLSVAAWPVGAVTLLSNGLAELVPLLMVVVGVSGMAQGLMLMWWTCPRCAQPFHVKSWWTRAIFTSKCLHCGLKVGS